MEVLRMKEFMGQDFLLETATASHLYHDFSEKMPLIDYHCHLSPKEIYEDRRFSNISDVWFGGEQPDGSYYGDHYKWRLMRSNAIPEQGSSEPQERQGDLRQVQRYAG